MELRRNTSTKEVDLNAMVAALGMNTEEALHLIEGSSPDNELENKETIEVVNEMLDTLTPREAKVLRLRFGIDCAEHTLEEAGLVFDVTKERIRQIEAKAMRKMKHPQRFEELWKLRQ
jgi:RNA polymerase sigma factor (sigma-70 family)